MLSNVTDSVYEFNLFIYDYQFTIVVIKTTWPIHNCDD